MLVHEDTLTRAWHGACERLFFAHKDDESVGVQTGSSMTRCYRNVVIANSMEFDLDVWLDLHLTRQRFPVLQRTYLDIDEYDAFMVRCKNAAKEKGAVTKLHANPHKPRGINRTKKTGNYAHGGCIHGWDFRVDKASKKPELALHSRVSYLPYMGGLDLALSYCIAREVGAELGFAVEDFSFVWYCSSFQFAHMQSVAYVWSNKRCLRAIKDREAYPAELYPTIKLMRDTVKSFIRKKKEGFAPEQEKFAQLMRYRRRWEARVDGTGPWSSIPLSQLNLSALHSMRARTQEQDKGVELEELV